MGEKGRRFKGSGCEKTAYKNERHNKMDQNCIMCQGNSRAIVLESAKGKDFLLQNCRYLKNYSHHCCGCHHHHYGCGGGSSSYGSCCDYDFGGGAGVSNTLDTYCVQMQYCHFTHIISLKYKTHTIATFSQ